MSKPFNSFIAFLPKALKTETYSKILSIKNTKKHLKNPNLSILIYLIYLSYIMNGWGSTIKDFPSFPQSEFIITTPLSACRNKCLMISHYIKFHLAHCYSKLRFDVDIASKGLEVFIHRGRAWGGWKSSGQHFLPSGTQEMIHRPAHPLNSDVMDANTDSAWP